MDLLCLLHGRLLRHQKLYEFVRPNYECWLFREVLYVKYPPTEEIDHSVEVFYFPYGVTVCGQCR